MIAQAVPDLMTEAFKGDTAANLRRQMFESLFAADLCSQMVEAIARESTNCSPCLSFTSSQQQPTWGLTLPPPGLPDLACSQVAPSALSQGVPGFPGQPGGYLGASVRAYDDAQEAESWQQYGSGWRTSTTDQGMALWLQPG